MRRAARTVPARGRANSRATSRAISRAPSVVVVARTVYRTLCRTAARPSVVHPITDARTSVLMAPVIEVAAIPAVQHAKMRASRCMGRAEVVAMAVIITLPANDVPGMSAPIGGIEYRSSEEEVVAVRVACIYGKVPETVAPVEWAIEVGGCAEGFPLPVEQDIAQVQVPMLPIGPEHIVTACYTHQIVEVDFVCSLILFVSQVQLVSHLVCQEEGFVACLLVAHSFARSCCQQHHCQGYHHLLHSRIFF